MRPIGFKSLSSKNLPYDAEIEYLESVKKQHETPFDQTIDRINTLQKINLRYKYDIDLYWYADQLAFDKTWVGFAGDLNIIIQTNSYASSKRLELNIINDAGTESKYGISNCSDMWISLCIDLNNRIFYKDGTIISTNITIPKASNNEFLLFGTPTESSISKRSGACRIRKFTITDTVNNYVVLDFIPVRKDGVGYMYDRVSGQLFGNSGTGNFILGPDKNSSSQNYPPQS